ncbi:hypothetical protein LSTR_LSTR007877, partial [Laodelphax striatellus]
MIGSTVCVTLGARQFSGDDGYNQNHVLDLVLASGSQLCFNGGSSDIEKGFAASSVYLVREARRAPVITTVTILERFCANRVNCCLNDKRLWRFHTSYIGVFSATMILICLFFAVKNIATSIDVYQKAMTTPFIKSDTLSVSRIPFPGVAICNRNRIQKSALIALANRMKDNANMTFAETYQTLEYLGNLGNVLSIPRLEKELLKFILNKNEQSHNLTAIITEVSQNCDDMLKRCDYEGHSVPCRTLFRKAMTSSHRSCCVMKNAAILPRSGKKALFMQATKYIYPGFFFSLDLQTSEYTSSNGIYGAEVLIFDSRSHPARSGNTALIAAGHHEVTYVEINPEVESITTSRACKRKFDKQTRWNWIEQDVPYSLPECFFRCGIDSLIEKCQ